MTDVNTLRLPMYVIDPSRVFPEVPSVKQTTADPQRAVAALTLFSAYILSGTKLVGSAEDTPIETIYEEIQNGCDLYNLDIDRVFSWAESLLIPIGENYTDSEISELIISDLPALGFKLRPFQRSRAAWAARRRGSILALDCGIGKTAAATAAAIAATKVGNCKPTRCHIYAPVNAFPVWKPYCEELRKTFPEVAVFSIDSAHNYKGLDRTLGGAVIYDELHKLKADTSRRGNSCELLRAAYDWSVGLTGTYLHAGAEGILKTQDIVLPGLSRFLDKWKFGSAFDSIYQVTFKTKHGREKTKTALGLPPEAQAEAFATYLSRGVQSLSLFSPEVAAIVQMPGHSTIGVSDWLMPDWASELQGELTKADVRNLVYWAPSCQTDAETRAFLGALALALMEEDPLKILPTWPKVVQTACKEGRIERVIVKEYRDGIARYRFQYPPGCKPDFEDPDTLPAGPKITLVNKWLTDHKDESLVVAGVGTLTIYLVAKMLSDKGIEFRIIRGGTSTKERDEYQKEFQDGKVRVMLMQQAAGADCITLTHSSTSILIDHNWSPSVYTQFIHRTYRGGQKEECEHYDYTFGRMQETVVRRLKRGERFDAQIRTKLEKQFWDVNNLALEASQIRAS
jgi:hypothetical protein